MVWLLIVPQFWRDQESSRTARTAEVSDAGSASSPHDIIQLTHVSQGTSVMVPYRALYLMPSWMEYKE